MSQQENIWVNCSVFTRRSLSSGTLMSWQLSHAVLSNTILRLSRSPFSFLISPQTAPLQQTKQAVKEQKGEEESKQKEAARQADENFGDSKMGKVRTFVWNLMEYPETSRAAQVLCIVFFQHLLIWFCIFKVFPTEIFLSHRFLLGHLWGWCWCPPSPSS